jgi:hypothetical protein
VTDIIIAMGVDTDEFASKCVARDKRDEVEKEILEEGMLVYDKTQSPAVGPLRCW